MTVVELVTAYANASMDDAQIRKALTKLEPVRLVRNGEESFYKGDRDDTWVAVLVHAGVEYSLVDVEEFQRRFMKKVPED